MNAAGSPVIGVLALQGGFARHVQMLEHLGASPVEVRSPQQLKNLEGLILPGGESTTIGKLIVQFDLEKPLKAFARAGKPLWGTCAGLILMARRIEGPPQFSLGLLDVAVTRNAFGRQVASFETPLDIRGLERPFPGIFIRAPYINQLGEEVESLAQLGAQSVAVRAGTLWGTSFHPELSDDTRLHALFLEQVTGHNRPSSRLSA